jgi:succinate dehydrogenase / fumarate reductase flavoprotein subunit
MGLDAKIPEGELEKKWSDYKSHVKLVNPSNKRKLEVIVIGTGLLQHLWGSWVIK